MPIGAFKLNALSRVLSSAPAVTSISVLDALRNSSTTSTITINAGAQAGDLAILFDHHQSTTQVVPTNWNLIDTTTTTSFRTTISYKVLTAGEVASTITGQAGTSVLKQLWYIRPNVAINSLTVTVSGSQSTSGTPTNQTVTFIGAGSPIIGFACYASTSSVTTTSATMSDSTLSYNPNGRLLTRARFSDNAITTNSTVAMDDYGTANSLQSFTIRFS